MKLSSQTAMVTTVIPLISAIIFAFDASFPLCFAFEASGLRVSDDRTGPLGFRDNMTLFLPLTHSWSTGGRLPQGAHNHSYRRHLKKASAHYLPSAQMPLFDDLLLNGYYTTRIYLGTPPQEFALIVDTGSTVTYVPCSGCENCGKHQDPRFQPELSSTYKSIKCNIDCTCDEDEEVCVYERRYAEMSSSSGVLAEDVVSLGNKSNLVQQRVVFGCEIAETGDLFSQRADGIMGLGRGDLSIMDQLVDKGAISDSFSLCYGGMDIGGGAMIIGAYPSPSGMVFTHSDPKRSPFYNIELKEIHVAGKPLRLKPSIFNGKYGTVLDSGTTYAYFPEEVYLAFNASIHNNVQSLKQIPGPDSNYGDICFAGAGSFMEDLLKRFKVQFDEKVKTPMNTNEKLQREDGAEKADERGYWSMVGGLNHLTHTQLDICYSVGVISRYMHYPSKIHYGAAKRILKYVACTINSRILYKSVEEFKLVGFTDSDWADSLEDRKSTSGSLFMLGSGAVTWSPKKQESIVLSSSKAEYVAAGAATKQAVWLVKLLADMNYEVKGPCELWCDNSPAISMTRNPSFHAQTKHIEVQHHYVRKLAAEKKVDLKFCGTNMQSADLFILKSSKPGQAHFLCGEDWNDKDLIKGWC